MANRAASKFEVSVKPIPADGGEEFGRLARLSIDKRYHGALRIIIEGKEHLYEFDYSLPA